VDVREALLNINRRQVMDNLIRTRKRLPVLQVDYSNMTGTVEHNAGGSFTDAFTRARTDTVAAAGSLAKGRTNVATYVVNASEKINLSLTGQPVTTAAVYEQYKKDADSDDFLKLANCPLKPGEYHLRHDFMTEDGIETWYIPSNPANRDRFLNLYLVACANRDKKAEVKLFQETMIKGVGPITPIGGAPGKPEQYKVVLILSEKVPNGPGKITMFVDGIERSFNYHAVEGGPGPNELTDRLSIDVPGTERIEDFGKRVEGKAARFDANYIGVVPIPVPKMTDEPVRQQIELLRLQQFNRD
jgi:hypothetical protein